MIWVTWPRWPPCPYMVKTLKNLLFQKQLTNDLETWYVALCMWILPGLFKLSPWVDLDPFYAKVKFGHIGFCMGKSENYLFFRNYCSLRSQSCLKLSAKWVFEVGWVSKVNGKNWKLFNIFFFGNYCSLRSQVAWSIQLNEFMKLGECQRSRPFFAFGQRSLRFQS